MSVDSAICSDIELSEWLGENVPCNCRVCVEGAALSAVWDFRCCCRRNQFAEQCWNAVRNGPLWYSPIDCLDCGACYPSLSDAIRDLRRL